MRSIGWMLGVCGVMFLAAGAQAQSAPNQEGTVAIGVERLFGLLHASITYEGDLFGQPTEIENSATQVTLLAASDAPSPYALPRLSLDYFLTDSVSLGAALSYGTVSGETETRAEVGATTVTNTTDIPDQSLLTLHVRGGYLLMFGDMLGLWPKVGFTYFDGETDSTGGSEDSLNGFGLNLDATLLVGVAESFGFTVSGVADLGLSGEAEIEQGGMAFDVDATITDFGLMAGVVGWL